MLEKFQMLSVNQMNAQIKLRKLWKAENVDNYPLKFEKKYLKMMQTQEINLLKSFNRKWRNKPTTINFYQLCKSSVEQSSK